MKYLPLILLLFISCQQIQGQQNLKQRQLTPEQKAKQEEIIETYATNKAHYYSYTFNLKEW